MGSPETHIVLVHDAPNIVEPICQTVHNLGQNVSFGGTVFDESAFCVFLQLIQQVLDLGSLGTGH